MDKIQRQRLTNWIWEKRSGVENVLAILSMVAVALVISTEFIRTDFVVPGVNITWTTLLVGSRTIIWGSFIGSFMLYWALSRTPIKFVKSHLLELLICLTWLPHYQEGILQSFAEIISFGKFVPLEVLNLVGTMIHAWRVVRWTAARFNVHPVFVTGSAALVLIGAAGGLLHTYEPETFPTFWHGCWYALVTVTTIGYGDLVPKTFVGHLIGVVTIIAGVSLFGVFIAVVQYSIRKRMLKNDPEELSAAEVHKDLMRNNELLEKILAEMATNNRLMQELLKNKKNDDRPLPDGESTTTEGSGVTVPGNETG